MGPKDKPPFDDVPHEIRSMRGRTDFGVPARLLRSNVAAHYVVETFFEDSIVKLLQEVPARTEFILEAAPVLHRYFGCEARLMLAAPSRLFEPIGPVLHVVIYTTLSKEEARARYALFVHEWLDGRSALGIEFVPTPVAAEELRGAANG